MRLPGWIASLVALATLLAVEGAYYLDDFSAWKLYAALFWIVFSVTAIVSTWMFAVATFLERDLWRLPGKFWYLIAFFLPPALILFDGGGIRFSRVDGEGLQQLSTGMYLMRNDPSLGVFRMGYFTYVARQYVLNCLPSFFLGPSLWASRVGTTMFYIGSYLFFLSALVTFFRRIRLTDPMFFAGYCGVMIALGQYTLLNARKFEQTTMPIAVTLFFIGALLLFLSQPSPMSFLWLAWGFGFFPECYTPALGAFGLALVVLLYLIVRRRMASLVPVVLYGAATFWVAFQIVRNENPNTLPGRFSMNADKFTGGDWLQRYLHGVRAVVGSDFALIPAPLVLAILAAACLAWRYRDVRFAAILAWAGAVACASLTFVGSNRNFPNYDIHRAMVILPPLAVASVLLVNRFVSGHGNPAPALSFIRWVGGLSMVYMVFTAVFTVLLVRNFFAEQMEDDFDEAMSMINQVVHAPGARPIARVYLVPPLEMDIELGLRYFAPDSVVVRHAPPPGEKKPGNWVFSYIKPGPDDRFQNEVMPSLHPRPYLRLQPE